MKIARFEPWPYIDLLNRSASAANTADSVAAWSPAVDILEDNGHFLLRADVPGVNPKDIDVSMDAGVLTISGTRHDAELADGTTLQRSERLAGRFYRRFTLPETADAENITAKSSNGILEVTIPKEPEVQPRRIMVDAA